MVEGIIQKHTHGLHILNARYSLFAIQNRWDAFTNRNGVQLFFLLYLHDPKEHSITWCEVMHEVWNSHHIFSPIKQFGYIQVHRFSIIISAWNYSKHWLIEILVRRFPETERQEGEFLDELWTVEIHLSKKSCLPQVMWVTRPEMWKMMGWFVDHKFFLLCKMLFVHYPKRTILMVKHGGVSIMHWGCFVQQAQERLHRIPV